MKAKLINPDVATGLIDPVSKRRPFVDTATGHPILEAVDLPDTSFWIRRAMDGDIRVEQPEPSGNEPIAPLTTRSTGARR